MKFSISLFVLTFSLSMHAFNAEETFKKQCSACHTIGGGDKIGPDLAEVSSRRTVDWIVKFVNYPSGMIEGDEEEEGYETIDPIAKKLYDLYKPQMMSEFELDKTQVEAILKYIDGKKKRPKGKITQFK